MANPSLLLANGLAPCGPRCASWSRSFIDRAHQERRCPIHLANRRRRTFPVNPASGRRNARVAEAVSTLSPKLLCSLALRFSSFICAAAGSLVRC